jgi:hypothetical protein
MEKKGKSIFDSYPISIDPDFSEVKIISKTELKAVIKGYVCENPDIVVEKEIPYYVEP